MRGESPIAFHLRSLLGYPVVVEGVWSWVGVGVGVRDVASFFVRIGLLNRLVLTPG